MEFTITTADLVRELGLLAPASERKGTIPILGNVLLEAHGERVTLTATDLEVVVRCSVAANVASSGAMTLPAHRLRDYIAALPAGDVAIKRAANEWAGVLSGRSKARIAGMSSEHFPATPEIPEPIVEMSLGALVVMIAMSSFAISREASRFTLGAALLVFSADGAMMVTTDGHRLVIARKEGVAAPKLGRILIPTKALNELHKLASAVGPDAVVRIADDANHLYFTVGDRLLVSRKLVGQFPDYERILPAEQPHSIEVNRDELLGAVRRVTQFADDRSSAIRVRASKGELRVHASVADVGESEESVGGEYEGPVVEVGLNGAYVAEFLKAVPDERVIWRFKDPASAVEWHRASDEGRGYRYVLMPMRI